MPPGRQHEIGQQDDLSGKSYGTTYVDNGSHALLRDVLQLINVTGNVHLHIHSLRQSVLVPNKVKDVQGTCRQSLRGLRNALATIHARLGDDIRSPSESRCIQRLADKTMAEIDIVLSNEAQRDVPTRLQSRRGNRNSNVAALAKQKLMAFCRIVEDRLKMIEFLVQTQAHPDGLAPNGRHSQKARVLSNC